MSMRVLIANIDKVLAEYISSYGRGVLRKGVHKNFTKFHGEKPVSDSVFNKVY